MTESLPGTPVYNASTNVDTSINVRSCSAGDCSYNAPVSQEEIASVSTRRMTETPIRNTTTTSGEKKSGHIQGNLWSENRATLSNNKSIGNYVKPMDTATSGQDAGSGPVLSCKKPASIARITEDSYKQSLEHNSSIDSSNSTDQPEEGNNSEILQSRIVVIKPDIAATRDDDGGRQVARSASSDYRQPLRCLLVSSKIKNLGGITNAVAPNSVVISYRYESATLDNLLATVSEKMGGRKVQGIGMVMTGTAFNLSICRIGDKVLSVQTVCDHEAVREFFTCLTINHLDATSPYRRLDFFLWSAAGTPDANTIAKELEVLCGVPVAIYKDMYGAELDGGISRYLEDSPRGKIFVGELYFRPEKLRGLSARPGSSSQSTAGYEKIRTVGKGAYGTAVLYRRRDDDSQVILKEINMHDLSTAERQMALNEVKVLAMLDHPNIISYYDNFEEDGVLMIEMEYADGGTLTQFLAKQTEPLEEKYILNLFQQMVSALRDMHEHNILHRDLKTQNIFLTKEGLVKVGDFGISKMLSTTNNGANTVLGTPYYISPEMCEGLPYNEKSDIWAFGCILYEMACRQRTFEGSNLPALVNKIMKGQFTPVKGNYSAEFKELIRDMLQREPEYRPSANELLYARLPELMSRYDHQGTDGEEDALQNGGSTKKKRIRSVLYSFDVSKTKLYPIDLPIKTMVVQVAASLDHVIVVTMERVVFTWGANHSGQLGHGDQELRPKPTAVEGLQAKSIVRACAGQDFSIFSSDNGIVMTCGNGGSGCLGHGDWSSACRPRLIEALLSVDVSSIACGPAHVVIGSSNGEVYSWGRGADGRLGLGSDADYSYPMPVSIQGPAIVRGVHCGVDGSMFITDTGSMLACGSNRNNKLGLNERYGFFAQMRQLMHKTEVEGTKIPTVVKALKFRILDISMGLHHTAVLVEPGHVITFGNNTQAQLGHSNTKVHSHPMQVRSIEHELVKAVTCGERFTAVCTATNNLYFWGTRQVLSDNNGASNEKGQGKVPDACDDEPQAESFNSANAQLTTDAKSGYTHSTTAGSLEPEALKSYDNLDDTLFSTMSHTDSDLIIPDLTQQTGSDGSRDQSARSRVLKMLSGKETPIETVTVLKPTPILRLDSASDSSQDFIRLSDVVTQCDNIFVLVDTTAPPPRKKGRKKRSSLRKRCSSNLRPPSVGDIPNSASSRDGGDEYTSSEMSEADTKLRSAIPTWLKNELAASDAEHNEDDEISSGLDTPRDGQSEQVNQINGKTVITSAEYEASINQIDPLSSSSSSETFAIKSEVSQQNAPALGITASVQYNEKLATTQRPLNRLRVAGRGRTLAPRGSHQLATTNQRSADPQGFISAVTQRRREEALQQELQHLQEEKLLMEEKLNEIAVQQNTNEHTEVEKKAQEREILLLEELEKLRQELQQQNSRMLDNQKQLQQLQENLQRVAHQPVHETNGKVGTGTSQVQLPNNNSQKQSKVCSLQ
ncbi:PREDICTED: uncharacterized protein LOC106811496 [Priapulus caudatus]|uniref:non-specific serine/threonine protein kinase n=1 Tax=Priapulus caudatus TaxID=37621 RepID=A0ABM1EEK1_PRICU|nr:PREDICTED: uncharacterized protein LOC106811496 [Priapulus caudatus]XP_014670622.1 PREDICTED: uncharacterized protein LOC106811496 [Priapulus caudatus]XP_014670623.1 PREDICTED: uncharacterized protein LOC106811496 [Priapulus caudatus]